MEETFVTLNTKLGKIRGQTKTSICFNTRYYAFQGIPYGKPPIGDLRFKAPQPFGGWEGVRDALEDGNSSKQSVIIPEEGLDTSEATFGDEDCLYLNIYINELPERSCSKKPLMVSIHGGGFYGGSGSFDFFGPDFIIQEDVVLVSINYRVGALGFLSLENEEVPGNAGLKDQNLALQWVRDNIDSFGGDSNNVTIFGISAGGASVHYHLLSRSSKGLFHKAIMQSGFSNNGWAFQFEPRKIALKLAKALGCSSEENDEILKFLQSVSADDIVVASKEMVLDVEEVMNTMSLKFMPCVEVAGTSPFLTDTPDNLMKKGHFNKVPVILGCTTNEGSINRLLQITNEEKFEIIRKTPELIVPQIVGLENGSNGKKEAGRAIWDFYFKDKKCLPWESLRKDFETFVGDAFFCIGMDQTRRYLLNGSSIPVYTYLFTNHTKCPCANNNLMSPNGLQNEETCHASDTEFTTITRILPFAEITSEYKEAIQKHVKAWARFASAGDPNSADLGQCWRKDSLAKPCFMEIGTTWTMTDGIPLAERINFWNNLTSKYSAT